MPASSRARSRAVPAGTTSSTQPSRQAPRRRQPSRGEDRSAARDQPTRRVSSWVPPPPGMTPTRHLGQPDGRPSRRRRSGRRTSASSNPPPSAKPCTAAIAGTGRSRTPRYAPRATGRCRDQVGVGEGVALLEVGADAERALRGWTAAPRTRTRGRRPARRWRRRAPSAMAVETALRASGRSRTSSATWPSPSALDADQRAGVGHRSSCSVGGGGRPVRTGVPARVSRKGSTLPTPRKVRGRSGTRANPDTSCSDSATAVVGEHAARVGDGGEARGPVDGVAEDVPQLGHHPARGQADAHVGEELVDGDRLDEVDRRRGGRRGVAVGEEDLVADRLDDATAVGRHDVGAEHLEPLDDLGELTLGRLPDQRC